MADISEQDVERAVAAFRNMLGGRKLDTEQQRSEFMVTMEHTIATALILLYPDPRHAAHMLNESLCIGVEERLAMYAAKKGL